MLPTDSCILALRAHTVWVFDSFTGQSEFVYGAEKPACQNLEISGTNRTTTGKYTLHELLGHNNGISFESRHSVVTLQATMADD